MIDLSDGLSSDLRHICRASNVGAKIYAENIPFQSQITDLNFALNGGEDFELLFTVNPKKKKRLEKDFKKLHFSHIGEITANAEMIELITGKKSVILEPKGYQHFW